MSLVKNNPKQVAQDMTNAYNEIHRFSKKNVEHFNKKISKIDGTYTRKGEKLTKEYIQLMVSDKAAKSRSEFFGSLLKKEYNGMSDINDRSGGANDPLIIFKPQQSLSDVKSIKLTKADLQKYWAMSIDSQMANKQRDLSGIQK